MWKVEGGVISQAVRSLVLTTMQHEESPFGACTRPERYSQPRGSLGILYRAWYAPAALLCLGCWGMQHAEQNFQGSHGCNFGLEEHSFSCKSRHSLMSLSLSRTFHLIK